MLSDDELVEQILLGNENAAEELIKRYYTSILRYCIMGILIMFIYVTVGGIALIWKKQKT